MTRKPILALLMSLLLLPAVDCVGFIITGVNTQFINLEVVLHCINVKRDLGECELTVDHSDNDMQVFLPFQQGWYPQAGDE